MNWYILPVSLLYHVYIPCISCMYLVHICMYCMYLSVFFAAKIVRRIDTYKYKQYIQICTRYIQICTRYIVDTYKIQADTYSSHRGFVACISIFGRFIVCISVCMCISCVYLVCILRGVHIRLYLHVSACICMYLHVCLYRNTLLQPCFEGVHMCMYQCVSVCMFMYVYVCVCIIDISLQYLYVLYAMAQNSTQAVTASSNDPLLGRESAGPTQGDPGQVPDHFTPPSGTHPRTRFGAPERAARVGGGQSESLVPPIGLP